MKEIQPAPMNIRQSSLLNYLIVDNLIFFVIYMVITYHVCKVFIVITPENWFK